MRKVNINDEICNIKTGDHYCINDIQLDGLIISNLSSLTSPPSNWITWYEYENDYDHVQNAHGGMQFYHPFYADFGGVKPTGTRFEIVGIRKGNYVIQFDGCEDLEETTVEMINAEARHYDRRNDKSK